MYFNINFASCIINQLQQDFDRGNIAVLHSEGITIQAIADAVGCHKSTISRD
jgi:IS30 family transposase